MTTTMTRLITLPLAHACGVIRTFYNILHLHVYTSWEYDITNQCTCTYDCTYGWLQSWHMPTWRPPAMERLACRWPHGHPSSLRPSSRHWPPDRSSPIAPCEQHTVTVTGIKLLSYNKMVTWDCNLVFCTTTLFTFDHLWLIAVTKFVVQRITSTPTLSACRNDS